jgi:hypothetical protein
MKAGISTKAIQNPCHAPITAQNQSEDHRGPQGSPQLFVAMAVTAPTIATTEPTDSWYR